MTGLLFACGSVPPRNNPRYSAIGAPVFPYGLGYRTGGFRTIFLRFLDHREAEVLSHFGFAVAFHYVLSFEPIRGFDSARFTLLSAPAGLRWIYLETMILAYWITPISLWHTWNGH
jgi:hypothetical protein